MATITKLSAYEVLDSRGNPTVATEALLSDGTRALSMVPSGASTGANEAIELRDGDQGRYLGRGVRKAIDSVNGEISAALSGMEASDQFSIDQKLIRLDGTPDKSRLGANAVLGASIAIAKAAAQSTGIPLYRHIGGISGRILPLPMMNVINGGLHADNPIDFQEFMILPVGASSFSEAVRMGSEVFHALKKNLAEAGHSINVGDEGGFAPNLRSAEEALDFIMKAIESAGYRPGEDVALALDPAASEFYKDGVYEYTGEGARRSRADQVAYLGSLISHYPILSIEDGMAESDLEGWKMATDSLGPQCQLVGDDVFCTSAASLEDGIKRGIATSILVKMNQVGTLSEMLETMRVASRSGYSTVMSHRSGETEDVTIADLAVATNCGLVKTGSLSRSDRTAKYNRLIWIERELGDQARYAGSSALRNFDRLPACG